MLIITLLMANAIAHVISFVQLRKVQSPHATGVFIFIFVNALLAGLVWFNVNWAMYLVLIGAIIGCLGLLITTLLPKKGQWVDYVILLLDISIISLSALAVF